MSAEARLKLVLCWHMHQPQYRDLVSGEYKLPWTYLHAIKDYTDMAAHLEAAPPAARAVVNFSPILLEQIDDYARQIRGFLQRGHMIHDPLLAGLAEPAPPVERDRRAALIKACLHAHEQHMIRRFPAYRRLADLARLFQEHTIALDYVDDQFLIDLLVWYHLAWLGETVRRDDNRAKELMRKEKGYSVHDRRELLQLLGELIGGLTGRYAALARGGRVELAVSPYAHPIVPLLQSLDCAREAMPEAPLPAVHAYPGGEARARWHVEQALQCFEKHFGFRPRGCWPSEGGVSDATLKLLDEHGFQWAASGESVLRNSLARAGQAHEQQGGRSLYRSYRFDGRDIACFFRDDRLSDQIGFVYADWHADDAVANLVHHLENIADAFAGEDHHVVSIVLDGENAWEYYPENGYYFLRALYAALSTHPRLEMCTFSDCLDSGFAREALPHLVAGSWVHGTFSTWIGEHDKNRGWEMLAEAKTAYDQALARGLNDDRLQAATEQLAVCEGSDWFWWFGGGNPKETVHDFDRLYRMHLSRLYQILGEEPPEYLAHAFTHGGGAPERGGTMRHGQMPA